MIAWLFVHASAAMAQGSSCVLPQMLQSVIASRYSGAKLVRLPDLDEGDRLLFQRDHGSECPGLVKVDFYGDGKPTLALVLISKPGANEKAELVLAHKAGKEWETVLLDEAVASIPVAWSQTPGEYEDVYGEKRVRATRPVIVFCGYNSWAILYAWTGSRVAKIWLED